MSILTTVLVTFFTGMGAGLGTGFAGMSAAAVISPMLITFLGVEPYLLILLGQRKLSRIFCITHAKIPNLWIAFQKPLFDGRIAERFAVALRNKPHFLKFVEHGFCRLIIFVCRNIVLHILIPPTLLAVLTGAQKDNASPFVLHMNNGKPLSQTSFSNLWDMVRRRTVDDAADLGKPARNSKMIRSLDFHVTPHQLRHTYITRLFESGLDIKEIQYLAGHSTVDMTLRVYTHYQHESRKKETAQKVCAALG